MSYDVLCHYGVIGVTSKAVLVLIEPLKPGQRQDDPKVDKRWIPKSLIENPDDLTVGDGPGEFEVRTWFMVKEGLL